MPIAIGQELGHDFVNPPANEKQGSVKHARIIVTQQRGNNLAWFDSRDTVAK